MANTKLQIVFSLLLLFNFALRTQARARDICQVQPSINGLCVTSTLGIYYDMETQRCKYMGCSPDKRLFATLEDCEKICNNTRHRRRRLQNNANNSNNNNNNNNY